MARLDPVGNYNFLISLIDSAQVLLTNRADVQKVALGGFSECSGLEMSLDIEDYQEGGHNGAVLKFPTRVTWSNIRLRRGLVSSDLWRWHYGFVQGKGRRRDGLIVLQNDLHEPVKVWKFMRGLPVKWTGPSMNATESQVAIEEIEIAHEGLELV